MAIDEGTYGKVWLAEDRVTGEKVALKQIKFDAVPESEGFPITALREANVLLALAHPNVVRVREMVVGGSVDKVYMVMDYMPHSLRSFLERLPRGTFFTQAEVKCLVLQLLRGVAFMHERWFLHRDLKTDNLLIDNEGRLCVCDFGLARRFGDPLRAYTPGVVTLWYRAPEVLLGERVYGPAVDMWGVGCIFAEILTKAPLFQSRSEAEAVAQVFKLLGTPSEQDWPGWRALPHVRALRAAERQYPPAGLRRALRLGGAAAGFAAGAFVSDAGLELLQGLLTCDPARRTTAAEALAHRFWQEAPAPCDPRLMPAFPSAHDDMQQQQQQQQQHAGSGGGGGGGGGAAGGEARA